MTEPATARRVGRRLCAIVAGAASGAGEHFARLLAAREIELLLVDREKEAVQRLGEEIGAMVMHGDILDQQCVQSAFDLAEEHFGTVNLLINAAGTGYVRTLGVMRMSREFSRRPRTAKAFVINLAATPDGENGKFTYAGSEIAFNRLTEGLTRAIEGPDLRVLTLSRLESKAAATDLIDRIVRELDRAQSSEAGSREAG